MQLRQRMSLVAVMVIAITLASVSAVRAQVLKQVPSNAMVVFKVSNLDATSKKVAKLATDFGLAMLSPDFADPLGALKRQGKIADGSLKDSGDLVIALINPDKVPSPEQAVLIVVPVSDYKAFITGFGPQAEDNGVTPIMLPGNPQMSFAAHWGDYAAISMNKTLVAEKPSGLDVTGLAAKELTDKDFTVFVNMKVVRERALPFVQNSRPMLADELQKAVGSNAQVKPYMKVLQVGLTQCMNVAEQFLGDASAATFSMNLGADGIATTLMAEFEPGSKFGEHIAHAKNTEGSLLTGLPEGKYILVGGSMNDPESGGKIISAFLDPIMDELTKTGDKAKPVADYVSAIKEYLAADRGETFGVVAPTAAPGTAPLLQVVGIRTGDAKALAAAQAKAMKAQEDAMTAFGINTTGAKTAVKPASKTIDGVAFDEYTTSFAGGAKTPQEAQAQVMMTYMYGPNGMQLYTGTVDANNVLYASGVGDDVISAALKALKDKDDPMAKSAGIQAVSSQLPKSRAAAFYLNMDVLVSTGLNYARQFGLPINVQIPDNLPPIGMTIGSDGTAVRADTYIPSSLVQGLVSAGMQAFMSMKGGNQGGGL